MRSVPVELDGHKEVISPLTVKQLGEFALKIEETNKLEDPSVKQLALLALDRDVLCGSINRANPDRNLTPEKCDEEFDSVLMNFLVRKVFKESGLEFGVPGEAKAV